jgi:hypothetical protein
MRRDWHRLAETTGPEVQHLLGFDEYSFELGHAYNLSPIKYSKTIVGKGPA